MTSKTLLNSIPSLPKDVRQYYRIYPDQYNGSPLGVGLGLSRFCREDYPFKVLYLAETLETAFVEVIVSNEYDGKVRATVEENELKNFRIAEISSRVQLNLVDLTGNKMISNRLHSGIVGNTDHRSGWSFSRKLRETRPEIDGILYPSRLVHDKVCLAIYEPAIQKLDAINGETLNEDRRVPRITCDLNLRRIRC